MNAGKPGILTVPSGTAPRPQMFRAPSCRPLALLCRPASPRGTGLERARPPAGRGNRRSATCSRDAKRQVDRAARGRTRPDPGRRGDLGRPPARPRSGALQAHLALALRQPRRTAPAPTMPRATVPDGQCVVGAIEAQQAILADRGRPLRGAARRAEVPRPLRRRRAPADARRRSRRQGRQPLPGQPAHRPGAEAYATQSLRRRRDGHQPAFGLGLLPAGVAESLACAGLRRPPRCRAVRRPIADDKRPRSRGPANPAGCRRRAVYPQGHTLDRDYLDASVRWPSSACAQAAYRLAHLLDSTLGTAPDAAAIPSVASFLHARQQHLELRRQRPGDARGGDHRSGARFRREVRAHRDTASAHAAARPRASATRSTCAGCWKRMRTPTTSAPALAQGQAARCARSRSARASARCRHASAPVFNIGTIRDRRIAVRPSVRRRRNIRDRRRWRRA